MESSADNRSSDQQSIGHIREIINNLNILTSFEPGNQTAISSIIDIIKSIITKFSDDEDLDRVQDYYDYYIQTLVSQLTLLSRMVNSNETVALISVKERNDIKKSIEFLIGFGIFPLLDNGVVEFTWKSSNLDESRKHRFMTDLLTIASNSVVSSEGDGQYNRLKVLGSYVDCLFSLWNSSFKTLISSNFLGYLLASLLQLASAHPKWDSQLVEKYNGYLKTIIDQSYRPAIIQEFIALQAKKSIPIGSGKVAPPTWLSSACGRYLSSFLLEPHGISTLLRTLDDSDTGDSSLNSDWKRCESLANLISSRPRSSDRPYYENICRQLSDDEDILQRYPRVFVSLIRKLSTKCKKQVEICILEPIFSRFYHCVRRDLDPPSEESLTHAVEYLKLLYASTPLDEQFFSTLPLDIRLILLSILFDIQNTVSYCRTVLKETIGAYLENAPGNLVFELVKHWILCEQSADWRSVHFISGSTGGVEVTLSGDQQSTLDIQERIEFLVELFADLSNEFRTKLFNDCLAFITDSDQGTAGTSSSTEMGSLKPLDDEMLSVLSLIVSLIERDPGLGSSNRNRMLKLLKSLLDKNANTIVSDDGDAALVSLKNQNLVLILGIIGALFSVESTKDEDKEAVSELQKSIQHLSKNHPDANVRSAAKDMHFAIFAAGFDSDGGKSIPTSDGALGRRKSTYEEAVRDLNDPLIPTRAHALVVLTSLIKSKDHEACSHLDELIPVIIERLDEEDSYVYLAAVNCLAVVGLHRPNVVLPIFMTLFRNAGDETTLERRLKLGEAIVKVSRELGDLAPFYGNDLINIFLSLLKQSDEDTKASCLSNIAEISRLMSFKLNSYIEEIFHCSKQLLQWEKSALVRRAAMNLLALLTESGDDFLEILGGLSRDFYRFIKDVYEHDEDHIVRLHAQKAIENLGDHAKKFISPLIVALK